jgi:hypothetical protein
MLTNILTSGAMAQIWGMINGMQIYSHLPLFKVLFPAFSGAAIAEILEIASFELIPLGDLTPLLLGEPEGDGEELLEAFADDFESYYTILNLGSCAVIFVLSLALPLLIILVLSPVKNRSKAAREQSKSLTNAMRGNIILRFIIETCLDIAICVILQFYYNDLNGGLFSNNKPFYLTNSIMTVILGPAVVIFSCVMAVFYLRTFERWGDPEFEDRYGAVFEGLRRETKLALLYPAIFIIRRVLFAVVAILFAEDVIVQIFSLLVFSTLQVLYLVQVKPFIEPLMQGLEIFNEVCTLALSYVMICLTDANLSLVHTANYYDYAFLFGMVVNLAVHVFLLIKDSVLSLKDKIKAKVCKPKPVPIQIKASNYLVQVEGSKPNARSKIEDNQNAALKLKTVSEEDEVSESEKA